MKGVTFHIVSFSHNTHLLESSYINYSLKTEILFIVELFNIYEAEGYKLIRLFYIS